jgi:hypothetical protein
MSTTQITVPDSTTTKEQRESFVKEVSTTLAAGNDVQFVNASGIQSAVYNIFLNSGGTVRFRGPYSLADTSSLTFVNGGWHEQCIGWIYASGTDTGLGIHVK